VARPDRFVAIVQVEWGERPTDWSFLRSPCQFLGSAWSGRARLTASN
jgi:hypothetical protein